MGTREEAAVWEAPPRRLPTYHALRITGMVCGERDGGGGGGGGVTLPEGLVIPGGCVHDRASQTFGDGLLVPGGAPISPIEKKATESAPGVGSHFRHFRRRGLRRSADGRLATTSEVPVSGPESGQREGEGEGATWAVARGPMQLEYLLPYVTFLREVWWVTEEDAGKMDPRAPDGRHPRRGSTNPTPFIPPGI